MDKEIQNGERSGVQVHAHKNLSKEFDLEDHNMLDKDSSSHIVGVEIVGLGGNDYGPNLFANMTLSANKMDVDSGTGTSVKPNTTVLGQSCDKEKAVECNSGIGPKVGK
ncbi:hypothetical protein QYF36_017376 [Acer negundo]|nr:hypothetical protein QYF36_017376 [Acer negundo]